MLRLRDTFQPHEGCSRKIKSENKITCRLEKSICNQEERAIAKAKDTKINVRTSFEKLHDFFKFARVLIATHESMLQPLAFVPRLALCTSHSLL